MTHFDEIAQIYAQNREARQSILNVLIDSGPIRRDSRVLEIGCGTGNYIAAIRERTGSSCWGIDPSKQMLEMAKRQYKGVDFRTAGAERTGLPSDSFDLVFSVDVIHHILEQELVAHFREVHRLLKPNGKICTVTDSEENIRNRRPSTVYFPETAEVDLARYHSIGKLKQIMEKNGFQSVVESPIKEFYQLTDARPYREKAFSSLPLISEEAFQRGIERMEQDLRKKPIDCMMLYTGVWGTKK